MVPLRFALALGLVTVLGCGGAAQRAGGSRLPREGVPAPDVAVSDDAFPEAVRALLAAPPGSAERASRLAGVEARQLERAVGRFKSHEAGRGVAAVVGGLGLIRNGELTSSILGPAAPEALRGAARELSARGDEGRAQAVFEIWSRVAAPADKAEIQGHLDALALWMKNAVARGGPMQTAGALENVAVSWRLLEPTDQALKTASERATDWIDKAFALRAASDRARKAPPSREEVGEALRALQTGALVLASIYLRDADAKGALAAIERAQAQDLAPDALLDSLKTAASHPSAEAWIAVLHALRAPREQQGSDEPIDDEEIVRAAEFGVAMEAYRLDPTEIDSAIAVAAALDEYGMLDACPLVLVEAARAHPEPAIVAASLKITMHGMQLAMDLGEPDTARRTYRSARALLDLASGPALVGKVRPSAANVREQMGDIEVGQGRLADGRALLEASMKEEKTGRVLLELARIDRHDKRAAQALGELREALAARDAVADPALRGEILLETSDLAREQGDMGAARTPLTVALKELSKARAAGDPDDRARAERLLSRVLDRFGAVQPAQRALDRAFDAAPRDKRQAAATVGQIVARAFVRGDLVAARDGLQRGLASDLDNDDIVYCALWVRLLERQRHAPSDGVPDRVFAQALDAAGWIGRLAAFGAGLLKPADLVAAAKTPAEKTEALFYSAMDRRALGDAQGAASGLREVVGGSGIELVEVAIARDLLDGPHATVGGPVPPEASLP